MTAVRRAGNSPRTFVKWGVVAVAIAGFAAIAIYTGPSGQDQAALPPEFADEPDVYVEEGVVTVFRDDGTLYYRLRADLIRHFEGRRRSTLEAPVLELHDATRPPWHMESQTGEVRTAPGPTGEDEERLELHGDVRVAQARGEGAFTRIRTESLTMFPRRQQARTEQTAMIETDTVSARVGGFEADLASGRLAFSSSTDQRVSIVVQPHQQTATRR